jgi:hypothetical protein
METKRNNLTLRGWQIPGYPEPESEFDLINESSEDEEYNFYNFQGDNSIDLELKKRKRNF